MRARALAAIVICGVICAGCASSSSQIITASAPTGPVSTDFIVVDIISNVADGRRHTALLRAFVISGLRETGQYRRVAAAQSDDANAATARIDVRILKLRDISDATHEWVGEFAGQADVLADVIVVDPRTGAAIATCQIQGKSSTTARALQRVGQEIVSYLNKLPRAAS